MTTLKQISKFVTTDNREFLDENEAQAHQAYLNNAEVVDAYIDGQGLGKAQAGLLRRHLPAFGLFKDSYVPGTWKRPEPEKAGEKAAEGEAQPAGEQTAEQTAEAAA